MNRSSSSSGVEGHKLDDGINGDIHANDRHIPVHHDEDAFEDEEVDVDDLPESMKPKLEKRKFKIDFLVTILFVTSFDFGLTFRCLDFTRKITKHSHAHKLISAETEVNAM